MKQKILMPLSLQIILNAVVIYFSVISIFHYSSNKRALAQTTYNIASITANLDVQLISLLINQKAHITSFPVEYEGLYINTGQIEFLDGAVTSDHLGWNTVDVVGGYLIQIYKWNDQLLIVLNQTLSQFIGHKHFSPKIVKFRNSYFSLSTDGSLVHFKPSKVPSFVFEIPSNIEFSPATNLTQTNKWETFAKSALYQRINLIVFLYLLAVTCLLLYGIKIYHQLSNSVHFPIKALKQLVGQPIEIHLNENYTYQILEVYYNFSEITELSKAFLDLLNSFKYYDVHFNDEMLLNQCQAKVFFKRFANHRAVGICASNISKIHFQQQRFVDSMNESQEAILIARKDLENFKYCLRIKERISNTNFQYYSHLFDRIKSFVLNKFNRVEIIETNRTNPLQITRNQSNLRLDSNTGKSQIALFTQKVKVEGQARELSEEEREYKVQKRNLQFNVLLRRYYFADTLYKCRVSQFSHERIQILLDLIKDFHQFKDKNKVTKCLLVKLYSKLSFCYIQAGKFDEASIQLALAYEQFRLIPSASIQEYEDFIDVFTQDPLKIQLFKLDVLKFIITIQEGSVYHGCQQLALMLRSCTVYKLKYIRFLMRTLECVFAALKLNRQPLATRFEEFQCQNRNIIILIEYSRYMKVKQFAISHKVIINLLNLLNPQDTISIVAFNDSIFDLCRLQRIDNYKTNYINFFTKLLIKPGGECQLESALDWCQQYEAKSMQNFVWLFTQGVQEPIATRLLIPVHVFNLAEEHGKMLQLKILSERIEGSKFFNRTSDAMMEVKNSALLKCNFYFEFV